MKISTLGLLFAGAIALGACSTTQQRIGGAAAGAGTGALVAGPVGAASLDFGSLGSKGELSDAPFVSVVKAFHLTNPIARSSVTMAECAAVASGAAKIAAE